MFAELPDDIKQVIILKLPCGTIRLLSLSCRSLNKLIQDNNLIKRRKFLGFPRTESHSMAYDFGKILELSYGNCDDFYYYTIYNHELNRAKGLVENLPSWLQKPTIKRYDKSIYFYLQSKGYNLEDYIDKATKDHKLWNHCATYNVKYLAIFDKKLDRFLYDHCSKLFNISYDIHGEYISQHQKDLEIVLNEIVDDLPIILIRGDIINQDSHDGCYYDDAKYIYDGEKVILLENYGHDLIFPKEFNINLNLVPLNYWEQTYYQEEDIWLRGIPGFVWIDAIVIAKPYLIKHDGKFQYFGYDCIDYIEFICNKKTYYLVASFDCTDDDFIEILESHDKLLIQYEKNVMFLSLRYSKSQPQTQEQNYIMVPNIPQLQ